MTRQKMKMWVLIVSFLSFLAFQVTSEPCPGAGAEEGGQAYSLLCVLLCKWDFYH